MHDSNSPLNINPDQALKTLRIIWAALLMGILMFAGITAFLLATQSPPAQEDQMIRIIVGVIGAMMVLFFIPLGLFIRGQFFKRNWVDRIVTPGGYMQGNIVAFAMAEGAGLFNIVAMLIGGWWILHALLLAAVVICFIALFPDGKPMHPPTEADRLMRNPSDSS